MLRKEHIQQKEKETIYMGLFTFIQVVSFYIYVESERNLICKKVRKKNKSVQKKQ